MFLGIEIGGTKLQLGVGNGVDPRFAAFRRLDVDANRGAAGIREQIEEAGRELAAEVPFQAIGFGFGGPINGREGIVTTSHQVAGWDNFPLVKWCEKTLGVPTYLGNDCDMAALAEARYGAGKGKESVFYVTVGTGVGGGLVLKGELFGSDRPAIAEIGHLRPGISAIEVGQTVEAVASGRGIEAMMRHKLPRSSTPGDEKSAALNNGGSQWLSARMIAEAAANGDALAQEVMDRACLTLGWAIAQVITLLAVEVVVVGGGVSLAAASVFLNPVREYVGRYVFPPLQGSYEIVAAQLGEEVVVHGAVAMAAARYHAYACGDR